MSGATIHATFVIERQFRAEPARTFRYFADPALKERWNACHPDWRVLDEAFDFRVGGREAKRWRTADGSEQTFTAHYLDIVAPERIVYAFEMSLRGERVSVSLATVELLPAGAVTRMTYTEQIAFFGSRIALEARIGGTGGGFDRLVELIAPKAAAPEARKAP
jgi:uncharacterized protein YndB with AHSA1/START domain